MLSFFEPELSETVRHVRALLKRTSTATAAATQQCQDVNAIVIVGGFGASAVVIGRIRSEFHGKNGIRVIMPDPTPKPQGAIVQGAVYFGLYKNIIDSRLSPYTYGIATRNEKRARRTCSIS